MLTVYAPNLKPEYRDKSKLIPTLVDNYKIQKEDIETIKITNAGNCIIEFKSMESFNLLSNRNASFCTDNGKVTPLNISDQNNYIIIRGIKKETIDLIEDVVD